MHHHEVLDFWFNQQNEANWFKEDAAFDAQIRLRFLACWQAACLGELFSWRSTLRGRLAEIIVLDQFSRNLNRDSALAWQQDGMALLLTQEALNVDGWDTLSTDEQGFMLMPMMHSESRVIHAIAVERFARLKGTAYHQSEQQHAEIIQRFGRYPHRNQRLNRPSTPEELVFLEQRLSFY